MVCPSARVLSETWNKAEGKKSSCLHPGSDVAMYENWAPWKQHVTHLCFLNNQKDNINPVYSLCAQSWIQLWRLTSLHRHDPLRKARLKTLQLTAFSKTGSKLAFPLDITPAGPEVWVHCELYHQSGSLQLWCYRLLAPRCRVRLMVGQQSEVWRRTHSIYFAIKLLITCSTRKDAVIVPF